MSGSRVYHIITQDTKTPRLWLANCNVTLLLPSIKTIKSLRWWCSKTNSNSFYLSTSFLGNTYLLRSADKLKSTVFWKLLVQTDCTKKEGSNMPLSVCWTIGLKLWPLIKTNTYSLLWTKSSFGPIYWDRGLLLPQAHQQTGFSFRAGWIIHIYPSGGENLITLNLVRTLQSKEVQHLTSSFCIRLPVCLLFVNQITWWEVCSLVVIKEKRGKGGASNNRWIDLWPADDRKRGLSGGMPFLFSIQGEEINFLWFFRGAARGRERQGLWKVLQSKNTLCFHLSNKDIQSALNDRFSDNRTNLLMRRAKQTRIKSLVSGWFQQSGVKKQEEC